MYIVDAKLEDDIDKLFVFENVLKFDNAWMLNFFMDGDLALQFLFHFFM